MREIPQIGFVLIAAVFMAGTATAVVRNQPRPEPAPVADSPVLGEPPVPAGNRLGPDVGQTTEDYERTSHEDLERVAADSPDAVRLALVTFSDYRTPAQVGAAARGLRRPPGLPAREGRRPGGGTGPATTSRASWDRACGGPTRTSR